MGRKWAEAANSCTRARASNLATSLTCRRGVVNRNVFVGCYFICLLSSVGNILVGWFFLSVFGVLVRDDELIFIISIYGQTWSHAAVQTQILCVRDQRWKLMSSLIYQETSFAIIVGGQARLGLSRLYNHTGFCTACTRLIIRSWRCIYCTVCVHVPLSAWDRISEAPVRSRLGLGLAPQSVSTLYGIAV